MSVEEGDLRSYQSALRSEQARRETISLAKKGEPEILVKAQIIGTEKSRNPKNDKLHVNYVIKVTTGLSSLTWHVHRRYQMFARLHEELLQRFDKKELPPLPPKGLSRNMDEDFTIKRMKLLNEYLLVLAQNVRVAKSDVWCAFLVNTFDDILECFTKARNDQEQVEEKQAEAAREAKQDAADKLKESELHITDLEQRNKDLLSKLLEMKQQLQEQKITPSSPTPLPSPIPRSPSSEDLEAKLEKNKEMIKQLQQDNFNFSAIVSDLQSQIKKLKSQKKVLVKEIKQLRGQIQIPPGDGGGGAEGAGTDGQGLDLMSPPVSPRGSPNSSQRRLVSSSSDG